MFLNHAEISEALGFPNSIPLAWLPNGNQIILSDRFTRKIYLANPDKKMVQELLIPTAEGSELYKVNFNSDGKKLLFVSVNKYANPSFKVFYYDLETYRLIPIGSPQANCEQAEWSPNGKHIFVLCDLSTNGTLPNYHVFLNNFSNEIIKEIAVYPGCNLPTWSPSGDRIAFVCVKNNERGLFLVNSDGSNYQEIQTNPTFNLTHIWGIAWSPNGNQLVYIIGENEDHSEIFVMDINGTGNHKITEKAASYHNLFTYMLP